jgi:hypothetical protein
MKKAVVMLMLSAVVLFADVTGKWSGAAESAAPGGERHTLFFTLKTDGTAVTGTGGPTEEEQHPVQDGSVTGHGLKFQVPAGKGVLHFTLTEKSGDEITGEVRMKTHEGEEQPPLKVALKRVK